MSEARAAVPGWIEDRLSGRTPGKGVARVLHALAAHPRQMSYASTSVAAQVADVNVATVVRAAQLLEFAGWPALRAEVRSHYLAGLSASQILSEHDAIEGGPARATLRRELTNLHDLSDLLDEDQIQRVAGLLMSARVTLVLGSGSFGAPGLQLAHLSQTIGYDARFHRHGGTSLINAVSLLQEGDCLVCFHLWRTPREILNAIRVAHGRGVNTVLVSDQLGEPYSKLATELVAVPSEGASMFPSLVPAITVVQAIEGAIVGLDPAGAAAASDRTQALWDEYDIFPTPPQ